MQPMTSSWAKLEMKKVMTVATGREVVARDALYTWRRKKWWTGMLGLLLVSSIQKKKRKRDEGLYALPLAGELEPVKAVPPVGIELPVGEP